MRVFDVWANYWPREFFDIHPGLRELYDRVGIPHRAELTIDDLVREAEVASVERVLLSSSVFPGSPITNDVLAETVSRHPHRLLACGSIDPTQEGSASEAVRCIEDLGFSAMKVVPFFSGIEPDARDYYPLYDVCQSAGIPVLILTGHTAVKEPSRLGQPLRIDEIALDFPELRIVAGHAGWPWTTELVSVAWKHEHVYIDTSGHRAKHWPADLVSFAAKHGAGKVMFGSGFPMIDYETLVGDVRKLPVPANVVSEILWGSAAGLLGIESPA